MKESADFLHILQEKEDKRVVPFEVLKAKLDKRPERQRIWRSEPALVFDLLKHKARKEGPNIA